VPVSSVNHWTGQQNQGQVSALAGGGGSSQGPPQASCLQPPFITPQLPAPFYNPPACPDLSAARPGHPTGATAERERADTHHLSVSLSQSEGDGRRIGKLRQGRGIELRPESPTLIPIGCQGVYAISSSQGTRRDVPLEPGMGAELTRRLPRRGQAGFVFGRFG